jgi:hypothetical protein
MGHPDGAAALDPDVLMADAVLTELMDGPAIDWTGDYKLEQMNKCRDQYISALRAADGHDLSALLKFVGE